MIVVYELYYFHPKADVDDSEKLTRLEVGSASERKDLVARERRSIPP